MLVLDRGDIRTRCLQIHRPPHTHYAVSGKTIGLGKSKRIMIPSVVRNKRCLYLRIRALVGLFGWVRHFLVCGNLHITYDKTPNSLTAPKLEFTVNSECDPIIVD